MSPYVPPWVKGADIGGSFEAGADLYLRMKQAATRKQMADMQAQYHTAELQNAAARLRDASAYHQAEVENQRQLNLIRQQRDQADAQQKAAKLQADKDHWAGVKAGLDRRLDIAEQDFQRKKDYGAKALQLKSDALDLKADNDANVLDLKNRTLSQQLDISNSNNDTREDIADKGNKQRGFSSIFSTLQKDNANQPPDKALKDDALADKAMSIWDKENSDGEGAISPATPPPQAPPTPAASLTGAQPVGSAAGILANPEGGTAAKTLDRQTAIQFLQQAKGDSALARKLATQAGYVIPPSQQ